MAHHCRRTPWSWTPGKAVQISFDWFVGVNGSSNSSAEAKGKPDTGEWASTSEFAADLARVMDVAQKSNQTECTVNLGDNYEHVKDRAALRNAVETIIQQLRDSLPHHASGVKYVNVKTGKTILTRGIAHTE